MAPRKYRKKAKPGMKVIELHINTHFLKVCAWGIAGFVGCFVFFTYVHIAEHVKPAIEAFTTAVLSKIGDSVHSEG